MKRVKVLVVLTFIFVILVGCGKAEKYEVDKATTLRGKIVINTIKKDDKTEQVSILELEKAITIDGVITDKIEIDYDKDLKNNTETTVSGTIKKNAGKTDLKYSISIDSIDNILSYINTFSNDIFSISIPAKLMKSVSVRPINDGFIIVTSNNREAFRVLALDNEEYKNLSKDDISYDVVKSNKKYTIVFMFAISDDEVTKEEQELFTELNNIKRSITLK
jgi:hypothetical protein